jgi:hypothetical protein
MYTVKFVNSETRLTEYEGEYTHLMDALKVCKETNIGDCNVYVPAIPDNEFDKHLLNLLTLGYMYAGKKTSKFPEGELIIELLHSNTSEPAFSLLAKLPHQKTAEEVTF